MSDKEEQARQLEQAFAQMAADQVRGMSDEDLARHAQATVALLQAIEVEYKRRNAVKAGEPEYAAQPDRPRLTGGKVSVTLLGPKGWDFPWLWPRVISPYAHAAGAGFHRRKKWDFQRFPHS